MKNVNYILAIHIQLEIGFLRQYLSAKFFFDGLLCQIYTYTDGSVVHNTLYANGTIPVQIIELSLYTDLNHSQITTLYHLQPSVSMDDFIPPKICHGNDYVCPGGNITEIEMYRFHPPGDITIDNRNTADALGDVAYVCLAGTSGSDTHISIFKAKVNTSWGQYQLCNSDQCVGSVDVPSVGHEAPLGINYMGGQCSDNVGVGNWYSFNASFKCANESDFHNCAWYQLGLGKTINVKCLKRHGFFEACTKDGGIPYPTALEIWNKAFKFDKSSQGGCPHVAPLDTAASDDSHQEMVPSKSPMNMFRLHGIPFFRSFFKSGEL